VQRFAPAEAAVALRGMPAAPFEQSAVQYFTVRARAGRLSDLNAFQSKSTVYGAFGMGQQGA
jgi:hypothetical protein